PIRAGRVSGTIILVMANSKTSKHKALQWPIDPKGNAGKSKAEAPPAKPGEKPTGRIEHDERGNAVWRRGSGDSTSTMLKKLDVPELSFEGQDQRKSAPLAPKGAAPSVGRSTPSAPDPGGGYNPYDQGKAPRKPTPPPPKAPLGKKTK